MYYLYHIKGIKWGCTKNLEQRLKRQGYSINDCDRIITTGNVDRASEMEKELNISHGYGWNTSQDYRETIKKGKLTHKKHPKLAYNWGKNTPNSVREKKRKPVLQFDLQGNLIMEYPSQSYVRDNLKIRIQYCLNGITKSAGGYIWKYKS